MNKKEVYSRYMSYIYLIIHSVFVRRGLPLGYNENLAVSPQETFTYYFIIFSSVFKNKSQLFDDNLYYQLVHTILC